MITCVHTQTDVTGYIYTYMHTFIYAGMHAYMSTYIHLYIHKYTFMHVWMNTVMHIYMQRTYMCGFTCIKTYMYAYIYIHSLIVSRNTHVYVYTLVCLSFIYTYIKNHAWLFQTYRHSSSDIYSYICHRGEYEYCGNGYIAISYRIFIFLQENTFITPLLMVSLCCIIDDIIVMSYTLLETINKHVIDSEVHNTARFQWVYIKLVVDCALTLRSTLPDTWNG